MAQYLQLLADFLAAAAQGLKAFVLWTQNHIANEIAKLEDEIYAIEAAALPDATLRADRLRIQLKEKRQLLNLVPTPAPSVASREPSANHGGDLHPANQ
jgi:hypothetical protein